MFHLTYPDNLAITRRNTPIQYLKRISNQVEPYRLWVKRDDLTGIELSGNKVRKLDFLMQEAVDQKSSYVFTCGGLQSNHCRATAFMAAQLGMKCRLFLRGKKPDLPTGNYFLDLLSGAEVAFVTPEEYLQIDHIMNEEAKRLKQVYVIPEGGSNAAGAWGYVRCFEEIVEQIRDQDLPIDTIVAATGSGGTHAGLLIGSILMASDLRIRTVNVCDNAEFFRDKILKITEDFKSRYAIHIGITADEIEIIDGYVGAGYGQIGKEEIDLIKLIGREEGLLLDPVYGVKAFRGMMTGMKDQTLPGRNILFIHTGGIFGLFPVADLFR